MRKSHSTRGDHHQDTEDAFHTRETMVFIAISKFLLNVEIAADHHDGRNHRGPHPSF
ncbi:Uncharacterised protein [Vibrio cholerae]|nr:Uncharacterised protein [Vibrio cholerae]